MWIQVYKQLYKSIYKYMYIALFKIYSNYEYIYYLYY